MHYGYQISNPHGLYFVTFTVVRWIDLFIKTAYFEVIINNFKFYRAKRGLNIHAFVIMTNHIHAILSNEEEHLGSTVRDLRKFSANELLDLLREEDNTRSKWILDAFGFMAKKRGRKDGFNVWTRGVQPKEIITDSFMRQKLNYIHQNPVRAGFVEQDYEWQYSSAKNYADMQGVMEVDYLF